VTTRSPEGNPVRSDPRGASVSALSPAPTLIARETELARFDTLLSRGSPALVLVTGDAGTGKSVLVKAVLHRSAAAGWTTAGPLTVSPDTEDADFTAALRELLGISAETLPGSTVERPEEMLRARESARGEEPTEARIAVEDRSPLIIALRRRQPLLIAVDGYRPSPRFHKWLLDIFVHDLFVSAGSVVIVFAERPAAAALIRPRVDEEIRVDAVGRQLLHGQFAILGAALSPPAERPEIDAWVSAVGNDPELIGPLWRALAVAQPEGEPTSEQTPNA
jgi:AAA ATPase domain